DWFNQVAINLTLQGDRINELYHGGNIGPWQTAHVVPPLLRFLHSVEHYYGDKLNWEVTGLKDAFEPVTIPLSVSGTGEWQAVGGAVRKALRREKHFRRESRQNDEGIRIRHQMGWSFSVRAYEGTIETMSIGELANSLDPFASEASNNLQSDLHLH